MKTQKKQIKANRGSYFHRTAKYLFLALSSSRAVEKCCFEHVKNTFDMLLLQKRKSKQELAQFLCLDKGYVSRFTNGKMVPPLRVRLKVAKFFKTDSALIWRLPEKDFNERRKS